MALSTESAGAVLVVCSGVFGVGTLYLLLAPLVVDGPGALWPYGDNGVSTPLALVLTTPTILVAAFLNWFAWTVFLHN